MATHPRTRVPYGYPWTELVDIVAHLQRRKTTTKTMRIYLLQLQYIVWPFSSGAKGHRFESCTAHHEEFKGL